MAKFSNVVSEVDLFDVLIDYWEDEENRKYCFHISYEERHSPVNILGESIVQVEISSIVPTQE